MHFTSIANDVPSGLDCDLYALLELGPDVFVDPYELEQQHWLWGTNDLELPVAAVDPRGSVLLLNLTRHAPSSLSVPLHARYPLPSEAKHIVRVPQPSFFWACDTAQAARPSEPFKDVPVPMEMPFGPDVHLYDAPPPEDAESNLDIPTGLILHLQTVDLVTKFFVLLMAAYIAVETFRTFRGLSRPRRKFE